MLENKKEITTKKGLWFGGNYNGIFTAFRSAEERDLFEKSPQLFDVVPPNKEGGWIFPHRNSLPEPPDNSTEQVSNGLNKSDVDKKTSTKEKFRKAVLLLQEIENEL